MPAVPSFNPVLKANAAKFQCALFRFEISGRYLPKPGGSVTGAIALSDAQYLKFHELFREFIGNCPMEAALTTDGASCPTNP